MNPDVIDVQPLDDYILRLIFEDGEVRNFDVKPYLDLGIFRELRDESYFQKAYVEFGSVETRTNHPARSALAESSPI